MEFLKGEFILETGITNGIFDPILAGIGTHSVTYTFTEANGCIAIATGEIVIDSNDIVPPYR